MGVEVLSAQDVTKTYGETIAVNKANFSMSAGEIHTLLGPNGAGKTTFIKILATLLRKDSGTVNILGYDLDMNEQEIKHLLGYVGQDTERSAYARLTPLENLRFFGALRGLSKDVIDDSVYRFAEYANFEKHLDKQFQALSGGQKQTVVIMRALLHDPPVIYLDEPTKGLDPLIATKIRAFLKRYAQEENKSLLLTSHIMTEVEELSDRVSLIHEGSISVSGTPKSLKESVGVQDFLAIEKDGISQSVFNQIENLDVVLTHYERDGWISYGVADLFDGTANILDVLKINGIKTGFRQHSVTLEDAFIHKVGELNESFD